MSFNDDLDLFTDSNAYLPDTLFEHGLVPPIPITAGPNPVLIWGWPVARRAAELGVTELSSRTIHLNSAAALSLALQLENRTGRYSWAEQEAMVGYLEKAPQRGGARDVKGGAGTPAGTDTPAGTEAGGVDWPAFSRLVRGDGALAELVGRYRRLGPDLCALVNDEFISLKTAERIARVPSDFVTSHHSALDSLSFSTRRQFLESLAELIIQASGTEAGAVSDTCTRASAALDEHDPVAALRRWRYPTLTRLDEQFGDIRRTALHGTGVDLEAPPYFEGDSFTVSFRFRDCAELEERTRALERLKDSCDQLFGIL
ncbi:MAG: hypothetical protein KAU31_14175 [Spirochaetaceae bacterium]|nr:hypothetical protein [Spirochaetaceae bacterium]